MQDYIEIINRTDQTNIETNTKTNGPGEEIRHFEKT